MGGMRQTAAFDHSSAASKLLLDSFEARAVVEKIRSDVIDLMLFCGRRAVDEGDAVRGDVRDGNPHLADE